MKIRQTFPLLLLAASLFSVGAQAEDARLKPYVLANPGTGALAEQVTAAKTALSGAGFEVVGEYAPYANAHLIVVTDDALKANAAQSDLGAFGAAQRVAVTQIGDEVQISYTNPRYMANAYRMKGELEGEAKKLETALGAQSEFGSEKGLTAESLRKYHYMPMMPYFTDPEELASFASQQEALAAVEKGVAAQKAVTLVYRVDLSGKEETVMGFGIKEGEGSDEVVMKAADTGKLRATAHLPYEMVISGGKVYMLHGRFRIAQSFPDLGMGTFTKIMSAPDAIEKALKALVAK